jgi:hypothetical protein
LITVLKNATPWACSASLTGNYLDEFVKFVVEQWLGKAVGRIPIAIDFDEFDGVLLEFVAYEEVP